MRRAWLILVTSALRATLGAITAFATSAAGTEFQVHQHTPGAQRYPAVAVGSGGEFVVVWYSDNQDGDGEGVFGRRFTSSGGALGEEFQVNSFTPDNQRYPAIAMAPDGGFVVAWNSNLQDGDYYGLFARRFDSAGTALDSELQINEATEGGQGYPSLAFDDGGGFVVTWLSSPSDSIEIFARRYDATAMPVGGEFQVNVHTSGNQILSEVGVSAAGSFTVVWQSGGNQDGNAIGVFGRRFHASGEPDGGEFQINVYTSGNQSVPRIAMTDDGRFVVVWHSSTQDGGTTGVFARRFGATGAPIGGELQVNDYTLGNQFAATVATDADGGFVVAWTDTGRDGSLHGVFGRRFDANGAPLAGEFQVNTYTPLYQHSVRLAGSANGDFVVAWHSKDQDGSDYGVFAQRYSGLADFDVDGDGSTMPLTDGILILRYLFGFRGEVLIDGAVADPGCTRCDAPSIEAYCEAHL